jgi:hypothetical protein
MKVHQHDIIYRDAHPQQHNQHQFHPILKLLYKFIPAGGKLFGFQSWHQYLIALLDR